MLPFALKTFEGHTYLKFIFCVSPSILSLDFRAVVLDTVTVICRYVFCRNTHCLYQTNRMQYLRNKDVVGFLKIIYIYCIQSVSMYSY